MKTLGKYLLRIIFSTPFIGAGILDAGLLVILALGLHIDLPTWVYGAALGIGFIGENFKIFRELEKTRIGSDVIVSLYRDDHVDAGDAITINQFLENPSIQPSFGLRIAATKPGIPVKGIRIEFSFQWMGDPLRNALTIHPPANDDRWQIVSDHVTNKKSAKLVFTGRNDIVTHDQPLYIPRLDFFTQEHVNGQILIRYQVTNMDSSKSNSGECVILIPKP